MGKYKICPVCGMRNNPAFLECMGCEADLQSVPAIDEETQKAAETHEDIKVQDNIPLVRVCDCGAKNPFQARKCAVCGEDISMVIPTRDLQENPSMPHLESLDGEYTYEVKAGTAAIGREHDMKDYLCSKPYVSRTHAELRFDCDSGILEIKNCSQTNFTFVNNSRLSGDCWQLLHDGDEIGLGGNNQNGSRQAEAGYFLVRIDSCT